MTTSLPPLRFPEYGDAQAALARGLSTHPAVALGTLDVAGRFLGLAETVGKADTALILGMLRLDNPWVAGDEVAWCSAFANFVAFILGLPRTRSLSARSWLSPTLPALLVSPLDLQPGDVVVLTRGEPPQPGPAILDAPGHVGFFVRWEAGRVGEWLIVRAGNQANQVCDELFPATRVLAGRRLIGDASSTT